MKKNILIYLLLFVSIISTQACSTCQTVDSVAEGTDATAFLITVIDPDSSSFERDYNSVLNQHRPFVFEFTSTYSRPNEELPERVRNFSFFFRQDGLLNGENLFEQPAGSNLLVGESAGQDYLQMAAEQIVTYHEQGPEAILPWDPTSYDGVVRILDDPEGDRIAEFDIVFTDGIESRRIQASYRFFQNDIEVERGECG